jgi:cytochrome b6-f complex iron-sulfur subunit
MAETLGPLPRRQWLLHGLQAGVAATLAAIVYPVIRFLRPRAATSSGAMEVVAPYHVNELKADSKPFNFGGKPCLLVRLNGPDGKPLTGPDGKPVIKAFNAVCTHLDCTVEFREAQGDIFCNCHNGVYDLNGRNVSGPPPRPLEVYKVTLRGDKPGQEEIVVSRST